MALQWIHENPSYWNADKARIIGRMPEGVFGAKSFAQTSEGELLANAWWRVEDEGKVVGYGWMDVTWGDAEILLAVDPEQQKKGIGAHILDKLEKEAKARGLNYLYNVVHEAHPARDELSAWLAKRGFKPSDEGKLMRSVVKAP